jgi:uncharacterized protein (TIGR00369 family)
MTTPRQPPSAALTPVAELLGRRLLHLDPESGKASLEFLARPEFANRYGTVQGGVLAAMLDSAAGATLMAYLPPDLTAVTVQLNTSFLKPAPVGPLRGSARVLAKDERSAELEAEIITPDDVVVARATAYFRIFQRK